MNIKILVRKYIKKLFIAHFRFRNMIETTVIPKKRPYGSNDLGLMGNPNTSHSDQHTSSKKFISPTKFGPAAGLYEGMDSGLHQR